MTTSTFATEFEAPAEAGNDPICRIGVDTGGTFTDVLIVRASGRTEAIKAPSTPQAPEEAILAALSRLGQGETWPVIHGTTVATNTLLEGKGAPAALITTDGFRDVLQIARQTRRDLYALEVSSRPVLIPRELCFEVVERVGADGAVVTDLDMASVARALDTARERGAVSVAISLLFSFLRPDHERSIGKRAKQMGLAVSLSSEIAPRYREYERTATACVCARVAPVLNGYLDRLQVGLAPVNGGRLSVMRSDGGAMRTSEAARNPALTVLSGPAGGAIAAASCAKRLGIARAISFDMGGTSTDICLIDGEPRRGAETNLADIPLLVPCLEIETVGAGGGSIAWRDAGGALKVGPQSAGADPGPAAYGKGTEPTLTDAHLLLGRIPPDTRLGGALPLDVERVRACFREFAGLFEETPERIAEGILDVADARMSRAIRRASLERGHDPERFALFAFGGAGGLHACRLARSLGMTKIVVPLLPGLFSACGLAEASPRRELSRSLKPLAPGSEADEAIRSLMAELAGRIRSELAGEGDGRRPRIERFLEIRYAGQTAALRIPYGRSTESAARAFHLAYRREFGHCDPALPVEIVAAGVAGAAPLVERPRTEQLPELPGVPSGETSVTINGVPQACPVFERDTLAAWQRIEGPAIVRQPDATLVVEPGWVLAIVPSGELLLHPG